MSRSKARSRKAAAATSRPRVTLNTPIGRDVDLSTEVIRDARGKRIDEGYVERLVEAAAKVRGRPSLDVGRSPQVAFRLPPALREEAARVAAAEGMSVSQLAREALEQRLHRSA